MRWGGPGLALLLSWSGIACTPKAGPGPDTAHQADVGDIEATPVSEEAFAKTTHELLLNRERGAKELSLLVGAIQTQLARSERRFSEGELAAGDDALSGAFLLLQAGQMWPEALSRSEKALNYGATEAARVGNAGRARALYQQLERILPDGPLKSDVQRHLHALASWPAPSSQMSALQAAGERQRISVQQALIDSSPGMLQAADRDVIAWIQTAFESDIAERPIVSPMDRDEALEAYRAVRGGGLILVALHLRHGDPLGALQVLDRADLLRILPPRMRDRLRTAGEEDSPDAWVDLFRLFDAAQSEGAPETGLDRRVARGAAWGAALGLYRSAPGEAETAMPLAMMLVDLGMADVATTLLSQNLDHRASAEAVAWSLALVLRAVVQEDRVGQLEDARRAFAGAAPLLELAEDPRYATITPRPARLHYVMGVLETRSAHLDRALPHFQRAVRGEATVPALKSLAGIERQRGNPDEALRSLGAAVQVAQSGGDIIAEAEIEEEIFAIERDRGNTRAAEVALRRALDKVLAASEVDTTQDSRARVERSLARILEHYGEDKAARRAAERALEASQSDLGQLTATLTDISRRALTTGDLRTARKATREALSADLAPEDLIYIALWQRLLERKLSAPSDGSSEEAFSRLADATGWVAKLRSWGRGRIGDEALLEAAHDRVQQVEAAFYVAMAKRMNGAPDQGTAELRKVAGSQAIDLVEVTIARDLLTQPKIALPADVKLP